MKTRQHIRIEDQFVPPCQAILFTPAISPHLPVRCPAGAKGGPHLGRDKSLADNLGELGVRAACKEGGQIRAVQTAVFRVSSTWVEQTSQAMKGGSERGLGKNKLKAACLWARCTPRAVHMWDPGRRTVSPPGLRQRTYPVEVGHPFV